LHIKINWQLWHAISKTIKILGFFIGKLQWEVEKLYWMLFNNSLMKVSILNL